MLYFQFGTVTNKAQVFARMKALLSLGMEWLGQMVDVRLTFKETSRLFSKSVVPIHMLTSKQQEFLCIPNLVGRWDGQSFRF